VDHTFYFIQCLDDRSDGIRNIKIKFLLYQVVEKSITQVAEIALALPLIPDVKVNKFGFILIDKAFHLIRLSGGSHRGYLYQIINFMTHEVYLEFRFDSSDFMISPDNRTLFIYGHHGKYVLFKDTILTEEEINYDIWAPVFSQNSQLILLQTRSHSDRNDEYFGLIDIQHRKFKITKIRWTVLSCGFSDQSNYISVLYSNEDFFELKLYSTVDFVLFRTIILDSKLHYKSILWEDDIEVRYCEASNQRVRLMLFLRLV